MIGGVYESHSGYPLSLLSKGGNVYELPSITNGGIIEYIVFIDVKGIHMKNY